MIAAVHNNGAGTLDISGTLTLANGPGGLRAGPLPVTLGAALAWSGLKRAVPAQAST